MKTRSRPFSSIHHPAFIIQHSPSGVFMRVGVVALLEESNTFVRERTTLAHFEQDLLLEGEPVRERLAGAHHEVGGFSAGLADAGIEAVPVFAARALPA